MPVDERRAPLSRYRCDLRHVVDSRASAYGYTLTVWFTGMVLSHAVGLPSPPLAFSFFLGAVLGFAAVGVVAFEGVTAEFGVLPSYLLDRAKELSVLGEEVLEALTD